MAKTDKNVWPIYGRLLSYSWRYKYVALLGILGLVVYAPTAAGIAYLLKQFLDVGFLAGDNRTEVRQLAALFFTLFMVRGVSGFTQAYSLAWVGRRVIKDIRSDLFSKYLSLPTSFYDRTSSGILLSKLTYNVEQVAQAATSVVTVLVRDTLTIVFLVAYMFYTSWKLSMLTIVLGPVVAWFLQLVSGRFRRYSTRIQDSMGNVTHVTEEALENNRVVKVFDGIDYERERFEDVNEQNRSLYMRLVMTQTASIPIVQLMAAIALVAVIFLATSDAISIEASTFVSFLTAMGLVMAPLKNLTNINAPLQQGIAAGKSVFDVIDQDSEHAGGDLPLEHAVGNIVFDDVRFVYDEEKGPVLKGISFSIQVGETVALVGPSGSGKSTIVGLLPRFYDVTSGTIRVDDHDIREYRLQDLRRQVAMVSQLVTLFDDTIANNIAYGALQERDREEIERAAEAAHVLEFALKLPDGLETMVGDRGTRLSGGQRQRIAIARALLKDAPILILDEATSALDSESERHIQTALETLMSNRTTLVIAHRLSTVENADRILVISAGRIAESGTHAELIENGEQYARLHKLQFHDT